MNKPMNGTASLFGGGESIKKDRCHSMINKIIKAHWGLPEKISYDVIVWGSRVWSALGSA
jgi:hypothetical protein